MQYCTLLTGATSGLGLETARSLDPRNRLILVGRSVEKLNDVASTLDGEAHTFCCDLAETEQIQINLKDFLKREGLLVNKVIHFAGIDETLPIKSVSSSNIEKLMRVNFFSIVEVLAVLLKHSVNKSSLQNIIFVSSISAIKGFKGKASYSASKAALDGYMRVLAKELAPKVVVNSIVPGPIQTPMSQNVFNDPVQVNNMQALYPLGIGSVKQVVDLIIAYHDMKSSWVTGQQIVVDGGYTA